jgi:hypothetical protein
MRAAALANVAVAETHRHVVDQLGDLEALQAAVAAMLFGISDSLFMLPPLLASRMDRMNDTYPPRIRGYGCHSGTFGAALQCLGQPLLSLPTSPIILKHLSRHLVL